MMNIMNILPLFANAGNSTLTKFFNTLQQDLGNWGMILTSVIGIVMVIVGIYKVAKNLISHGKGQNNWVVAIALIVLGGALAIAGGWKWLGQFSNTTTGTLNEMANGNVENQEQFHDPFTGNEITTP